MFQVYGASLKSGSLLEITSIITLFSLSFIFFRNLYIRLPGHGLFHVLAHVRSGFHHLGNSQFQLISMLISHIHYLSCLQLLCLIGRALNIFSLSFLVNKFREHEISRKNQFVMWFSGKERVASISCTVIRSSIV
jgi:hypothetical protein